MARAPAALVYDLVCAGCHASGAYQAPDPAKPDDWKARSGQSRELFQQRTLEGYGAMPARGLCELCTDEQLRATVELMLERAGIKLTPD
jgi:cytochrome c5